MRIMSREQAASRYADLENAQVKSVTGVQHATKMLHFINHPQNLGKLYKLSRKGRSVNADYGAWY